MKNLVRIIALFITAISVASCGNTLVTEHLQPAQKTTIYYQTSDWAKKVYCGLNTKAVQPFYPAPPSLWVGYKRTYDAGTEPFPCWEWENGIYRAAFRFDLSKYAGKKILSAILNIRLGQGKYITGSTASNEGVWVKSLGLASTTWWNKGSPYQILDKNKFMPWTQIPGMPDLPHGVNPPAQGSFPVKYNGHSYQIEVSSVVRHWVDGTEPNLGFLLIGTNEKTVGKNRDAALSPVTGLGLDITFSTPQK